MARSYKLCAAAPKHHLINLDARKHARLTLSLGPLQPTETQNRITHILRVFDFDPTYGPSLGLTRLERWERARNLGDEPPHEIAEILRTKQGMLMPELRESVLTGMGV